MHIVVVGLNYKTAPVEIRERLTFDSSALGEAMSQLQKKKSILENIIISTCNRTEIYAVVDQLHTGRYYIKEFLSEWFEIDQAEFSPYIFIYEQDGAMNHLFQVACGLNSMVVGETQILGQVRASFLEAQAIESSGTVFNQLFKQAVTLAKKAHTETDIGANAVSVSYAAVELAKKIFGTLDNKNVLILGAGKMGELAIQNLYSNGAKNVTVINRTFEKAQSLAERFEGQAKSLSELQCALIDADILISSTGASSFVITKSMMNTVEKIRKGKPLFMVDIAVPRDLDPALAELDSVFLYDIDDLEGIVEANLQERQREAAKIMLMIEQEIVEFNEWLHLLGIVPVISALRDKALAIQGETMKSIERKLPHLSDRDKKVLNKHTKSIINQMLKDPILHAKELASSDNREQAMELFVKIFNLEQDVQTQTTVVKEEKKVVSSLQPNFQG
ncbi:glutamyl-tRNA reductase [Niallia taxi]|uniref:Glutamyl-tRNA reductase n=1 Tax=Niallia taxi TaxID=2499688 RepID=A0A437KDG4_9BACI|nr:glutamyl-tRNA reductase [Niallia taxi]MCM3215177.1 glutamyl-tRNA reductase [Niallia taxi]MDK8639478.1 glutamyl-tRNA reductase [Niallia taxi]MED4037491.1 glutamyl-tRNA reductase [Niallia taxi]MED4055936.1 glutamyl-tRNA reductase [Niallia taxi]MED4117932.1 glutamyl-tRNA reductase [Niallia taxi]